MKRAWKQLAGRINSLSLRERGIIFCMLAAVVAMLLNLIFLDPLSDKEKALTSQLLQMEGGAQSLRKEMLSVLQVHTNNPNSTMQVRLDTLKKKLSRINYLLQEKRQQLIAPNEMTQVLKAILIQNRTLQLLVLRNLPTELLIKPASNDGSAVQANASGVSGSEVAAQVFKHGVEITVQGSYFDLLAYLEELEKIPSQMYWERVTLKVSEYPASILTFTVYTLSLDEAWLKV